MGAEVIILFNPYTYNFLKGLTHSALVYVFVCFSLGKIPVRKPKSQELVKGWKSKGGWGGKEEGNHENLKSGLHEPYLRRPCLVLTLIKATMAEQRRWGQEGEVLCWIGKSALQAAPPRTEQKAQKAPEWTDLDAGSQSCAKTLPV